MKILYRQNPKKQGNSPFNDFGIGNCYFKSIESGESDGSSTKKRHSHTGYEFHLVLCGEQRYDTCDGVFSVCGGHFLAIPGGRAHRLISSELPVSKFAFTFSFNEDAWDIFELPVIEECRLLPIPARILSNLSEAARFFRASVPSSSKLLENCVFETVILLLREIGVCERAVAAPKIVERSEDGRVEMAKQYVKDNIESPIAVREVAAYCYVSEKQLTRLFYSSEGLSPATYIRRERIKHIEELLRDNDISLSEISLRMGFPNESGFNAFFKKYNGMPPGEYRKMVR